MTKHEFEFNNGDLVIEKVTGFKGVITGSVYYLTGCNQYLVTAKAKSELSLAKAQWYDEGRIELLNEKIISEEKLQPTESKKRGCDTAPPIK